MKPWWGLDLYALTWPMTCPLDLFCPLFWLMAATSSHFFRWVWRRDYSRYSDSSDIHTLYSHVIRYIEYCFIKQVFRLYNWPFIKQLCCLIQTILLDLTPGSICRVHYITTIVLNLSENVRRLLIYIVLNLQGAVRRVLNTSYCKN